MDKKLIPLYIEGIGVGWEGQPHRFRIASPSPECPGKLDTLGYLSEERVTPLLVRVYQKGELIKTYIY